MLVGGVRDDEVLVIVWVDLVGEGTFEDGRRIWAVVEG